MNFEDVPPGQDYWYARNNARELLGSQMCGCYNCAATFAPGEINEWHTSGTTDPAADEDGFSTAPINEKSGGHCPHCATDFILGDSLGWPVSDEIFLEKVRHSVGSSWNLN